MSGRHPTPPSLPRAHAAHRHSPSHITSPPPLPRAHDVTTPSSIARALHACAAEQQPQPAGLTATRAQGVFERKTGEISRTPTSDQDRY
uniref:Uncharacterized protein n=1 Tax=Oryza sativa subsp. japonica TaxID=39947 RepID=Q652I2_ORYSJ|nr:hypothetical protein [Oryza sativa Japonica Group]BAD46285.1 hypothetical protein [Oryza sativa Japonica Group]